MFAPLSGPRIFTVLTFLHFLNQGEQQHRYFTLATKLSLNKGACIFNCDTYLYRAISWAKMLNETRLCGNFLLKRGYKPLWGKQQLLWPQDLHRCTEPLLPLKRSDYLQNICFGFVSHLTWFQNLEQNKEEQSKAMEWNCWGRTSSSWNRIENIDTNLLTPAKTLAGNNTE